MPDETETPTNATPTEEAAPVAEAPAPQEPPAVAPAEEPADQVVEGHLIPNLMQEHVLQLEFIRDFCAGVPYAVDAVNTAKAG